MHRKRHTRRSFIRSFCVCPCGLPDRIRTCDLKSRSLARYPAVPRADILAGDIVPFPRRFVKVSAKFFRRGRFFLFSGKWTAYLPGRNAPFCGDSWRTLQHRRRRYDGRMIYTEGAYTKPGCMWGHLRNKVSSRMRRGPAEDGKFRLASRFSAEERSAARIPAERCIFCALFVCDEMGLTFVVFLCIMNLCFMKFYEIFYFQKL